MVAFADGPRVESFGDGSSTSTFKKSRASSSMGMGRSGSAPTPDSSAVSGASSYVATVCPFARWIGRFNSAWAGRGGVGSRAFRFDSRMW